VIGEAVARFVAKYFREELLNLKSFQAGEYKKSLEEVFLRLDQRMLDIMAKSDSGNF
jgi:hypothetical protein